MFKINDYQVRFYHYDNKTKNPKRRKRITTCNIFQSDIIIGTGQSGYKETDAKEGLPYDKGFARRLALKRALDSIGDFIILDNHRETFNKEFCSAVWNKYFSMVSKKEQGLRSV